MPKWRRIPFHDTRNNVHNSITTYGMPSAKSANNNNTQKLINENKYWNLVILLTRKFANAPVYELISTLASKWLGSIHIQMRLIIGARLSPLFFSHRSLKIAMFNWIFISSKRNKKPLKMQLIVCYENERARARTHQWNAWLALLN